MRRINHIAEKHGVDLLSYAGRRMLLSDRMYSSHILSMSRSAFNTNTYRTRVIRICLRLRNVCKQPMTKDTQTKWRMTELPLVSELRSNARNCRHSVRNEWNESLRGNVRGMRLPVLDDPGGHVSANPRANCATALGIQTARKPLRIGRASSCARTRSQAWF